MQGIEGSSSAGSYVLALRLNGPRSISVGRLGSVQFPAGWYLYVGSARGPGGLRARLARHRRRVGHEKRLHWHVDFVREAAAWGGAWANTSGERLECTWAAQLCHLPNAEVIAPGFGASDCRCPAHLVHVPVLPDDGWFADYLGARRVKVETGELDRLLEVLAVGDEEKREAAALALGRVGAAAVEPLAAMLTAPDADARWWAARSLAEVSGDGSLKALTYALADDDPDVRACAALALGRIGEGAAAPALADRLADESAFVASVAADALSMIGEPAVEALVKQLAAPSPHTRLLAVRALGRINSARAVDPLFGVLEDSSYLVCHYAHEALEALGAGMVFVAP